VRRSRKWFLAAALLGPGTSPAARIRGWYRLISIQRIGRKRALLASFALPFTSVPAAVRAVRAYGRPVADKYGVSRLRQAWQAWYIATFLVHNPTEYYQLRLFKAENRPYAGAYIGQAPMNRLLRWVASRRGREEMLTLSNKDRFYAWCRERSLPAPELYGLIRETESGGAKHERYAPLPERSLFTKPIDSSSGRGAKCWCWDAGEGKYTDDTGTGFTENELLASLAEQLAEKETVGKNPSVPSSQLGAILIQERVENHEGIHDLASRALSTVRIVTMTAPGGGVEVLGAAFRMGMGDSVIDNASGGGIFCGVNLDTGELGPAISKKPDESAIEWRRHPHSGQPIVGRHVPAWAETIALAVRAQRCLAHVKFVGWDVGISSVGPVLIEANVGWGSDVLQMPAGLPLARTRFGEYYLHYCAELLDARA
jgi:hypothetical protein